MLGRVSQDQNGGAESTNYQAARDVVVHQSGVSVTEVREIVKDAIRANMFDFRAEAQQIVNERITWFSERYVDRMAEEDQAVVESAKDPAMQHALIQAGTGYARIGDEDMGEILVDLLIDRAKAKNRSLMAVVVDDAVAVAPRLTDGEIAILTIFWSLVSTRDPTINSLPTLAEHVLKDICPLVPLIPRGEANYLHLQALGCVAVQVTEIDFSRVWLSRYPGLFSNGFTEDEMPEDLRVERDNPVVFTTCLRDPSKLQVNALTTDVVESVVGGTALEGRAAEVAALMNAHQMNEAEVLEAVSAIHPAVRELADIWKSTPLKSLRVSAVGIAIAHANARRLTGYEPLLSEWISEDGPPEISNG